MSEAMALLAKASGLQSGAGIGSAIAGLFVPGMTKKVNAEVDKTRNLIAGINAKRTARDLRYAQGMALVQNAAVGVSGAYGSALYAAADDARKKEEHIQNEYLQAKLEGLRAKAAAPTGADAAFNLVGSLTSAYGAKMKVDAAGLGV